MSNNFSSIKRFYYAVTEPECLGLSSWLLSIAALLGYAATRVSGVPAIVCGGISLIAGTVWLVVVRAGLNGFDAQQLRAQKIRAIAWARAGRTPEERRNRILSVESLGAGLAFGGYSGLYGGDDSLTLNVDGTPMIPGAGIDVHGNTFGTSDAPDTSEFSDPYPWDPGVGAYHHPIGLEDSL
jgi:hypothetical protein